MNGISAVDQPPSLWYFAIAALADKIGSLHQRTKIEFES